MNRWPAGDQTRASGWTSRFSTRLVNVATGSAPAGFKYDSATGALRYAGAFEGDVTVRLERTDAAISSNKFRIRVVAPTFVYGDNAAAIIPQRTAGRRKPARRRCFSKTAAGRSPAG